MMLRNLCVRFASALSSGLLALAALALAPMQVQAQTVTFASTASASASGSGALGTPTLTFNVAAGRNRIVFITAAFERDHCIADSDSQGNCTDEPASAANSNFAGPNFVTNSGANMQLQFTASGPGGALTFTNPLAPPNGDLRFITLTTSVTGGGAARAYFSQESYFTALYESDLRQLLGGAASGLITVTLPDVQVPRRAGDEALLTGLQFNNVSQRRDGNAGTGIVRSLSYNGPDCNSGVDYLLGLAPGNWSLCLNGYDAGQAPTAAGDGVLLYGYNGYAGSAPMGFATFAGFTEVANPAVINTNPLTGAGTSAGAHFVTGTESDGFSSSFQFRNGVPPANINLQSRNGSGQTTTGGIGAKFTLTRGGIDLNITKTNGTTSVSPGATTTYTIVVTNPSVNFADGAVVTDPIAPGLTVTNVTCAVTTGSAACPSSLTQASQALRVAALQSGATIASFPPNSSLTLTVTATVGTGVASVSNTATLTAAPGDTDLVPANNTATDTDTVLGTIVIVKDAIPDSPQDFSFTTTGGSGLPASFDLDDDPTDATLPNSRTFYVTPGATVYTVKEAALPSGWTQSSVSCTSGGTVASGTASITVAAGQTVTCTFTNAKIPTVKVQKVTLGRTGGPFNFTQTNLASAPAGITTTTAGTPTPSSPTPINVTTTGTAVTLTEGPLTGTLAGWALVSASCTDANSAATGNTGAIGTLAGSTLTIPAANVKAGADFTCVFTNARPRIRLNKLLPDGRVVDAPLSPDQFSLSIVGPSGGTASASTTTTTTGSGTTATGLADTNASSPANSGGTYVLSEAQGNLTTVMALYVSSLSCTNATAGSTTVLPSGSGTSGFSVTPIGNDDITCTFTNRRRLPQLTTTKTASANPMLVGASGQRYTITITVANGPTTAPITLTDALPAGITTSGPVTATGGTLSGCPAAGATNLTGCSIATGVANGSIVITVPVTVAVSAVGPSGATNTVNVAGGGDPLCTVAAGQPCDASTTTTAVIQPATLQLAKAWGAGSLTGNVASIGASTGGASNTTAFTATAPTAGNSGTAVNVVAGNTITLPAETMTTGTLTNYNTVLACTANNGATANALSGTNGQTSNTLLIGAADAGQAIVCTYTNTAKTANVTLAKTWSGAIVNDAVSVTGTGLTPLASVANTAAETDTGTALAVPVGSVITLAESFTTGSAANYTSALSCTGTSGLSGSTLTIGAADTAIVCTYTNTRKTAAVTLSKSWSGAIAGDKVNLTVSGSAAEVTGATAGTSTAPATTTNATAAAASGATVTLAEAFTTGNAANYTTTLACTKVSDGSTVPVSGSGLSRTFTMPSDSAVSCAYTNTRKTGTLQLFKAWGAGSTTGNVASIGATTGGASNTTAFTATAPVAGNSGTVVSVAAGDTLTFPAETMTTGTLANYTTVLSCTADDGPTANALSGTNGQASNTLVIGVGDAGKAIVCTYSNNRLPTVQIRKQALGGTGTFAFSGTNGFGADSINVSVSGSTVVGTIKTLSTANTQTVLTEVAASMPGGFAFSGATCTGLAGGATAAVDLVAGTVTLPAAGLTNGSAVVCTFTNTLAAIVSGRVFLDNGISGGTANDGIVNGGEGPLAGVSVRLTNCGATVYASALTDASGGYSLSVPAGTATGSAMCVEETNPGTRVSTGASVGNVALPSGSAVAAAGGTYTYTRTATPDRIAFSWNGTGHSNLNFGDVDNSAFATGGAKTGQPGNTVTYAHTFTAGTAGSVTFAISASTSTPNLTGWAEKIFADPTCSGSLQPGAATLYPPSAPIAVTVSQTVCVIVQEFIPATAQPGYSNDAKVQANFILTNSLPAPALSASYTLDDITTVSTSALELKKEVRNLTQGAAAFSVNNQAKSGETLEYRVTYTNNGTSPIGNLTVNDTTPAYTTFISSMAGTTPVTLTACRKVTPANPPPSATVACNATQSTGGAGSVSWTFTGALNPGGNGTVLFQVKVD